MSSHFCYLLNHHMTGQLQNHCRPIKPMSTTRTLIKVEGNLSKHGFPRIPMQSICSISHYRNHGAFRPLTWKSENCWHPASATSHQCRMHFFNHLFHALYLQEVQLKIKEEFLRTKTDPGCQEAYSSFQYLHEKLGHIKKLVHNYDQERLGRR